MKGQLIGFYKNMPITYWRSRMAETPEKGIIISLTNCFGKGKTAAEKEYTQFLEDFLLKT